MELKSVPYLARFAALRTTTFVLAFPRPMTRVFSSSLQSKLNINSFLSSRIFLGAESSSMFFRKIAMPDFVNLRKSKDFPLFVKRITLSEAEVLIILRLFVSKLRNPSFLGFLDEVLLSPIFFLPTYKNARCFPSAEIDKKMS